MQDEVHVFELLPGYALGSLDESDAALVTSHLASCTTCRTELGSFETVVEELALPLPAASPSPGSKRLLMDRIQSLPAAKPVRALVRAPAARPPLFQRLLPAWGVVSLLLIAGLAAGDVLLWQRVNNPGVYTGPLGMRAVALNNNAAAAPQASGIVIISADGQNGVLVVDELAELDATKQYQVWLYHGDQATRGPAFNVDKTGYRGTRIIAPDSLLSYSSIRVTIEPVNGAGPSSTGEQVLGGPLHNQ